MIKGLQKTSLIDYPGKIACTIFIGGCNFRCGYCYNSDLVFLNKNILSIPEDEVISFLYSRKKYLEGVCITGGEPTSYKGIIPLIMRIKALGFKVKIDTNGSNPSVIRTLLVKKLVDYIAMDIKSSLDSYENVAGAKVDVEKLKESIELIKNSSIEYEFRTTVVPDIINEEEIHKIGAMIRGASKYFIQQFKPDKKTIDSKYRNMEPLNMRALERFKSIAEQFISKVEIRNYEQQEIGPIENSSY